VVDVDAVEIAAQEVRLPERAVEALAEGRPVVITRYGRRQHVLLSEAQFALVEPLLDLLQEGVTVSPELLLTDADLELERELDRDDEPTDAENAQIAALLSESKAE
jgi:PHD/YefM family antitoxin component YafN of YafNO toxin-antitoxin module